MHHPWLSMKLKENTNKIAKVSCRPEELETWDENKKDEMGYEGKLTERQQDLQQVYKTRVVKTTISLQKTRLWTLYWKIEKGQNFK